MQHGAHGSRRPPQGSCDLFDRHTGDQIKQTLLLWLGPFPIPPFLMHAGFLRETDASVPRISRDLCESGYQGTPV